MQAENSLPEILQELWSTILQKMSEFIDQSGLLQRVRQHAGCGLKKISSQPLKKKVALQFWTCSSFHGFTTMVEIEFLGDPSTSLSE